MANLERRISPAGASLRASSDKESMVLQGYAATFGPLSGNLSKIPGRPWHERIDPKAFEKTLRSNDGDTIFCPAHDDSQVMGRVRAGTLKLKTDDRGLSFRCMLPDTEAARALHQAVSRGDLDACSFSFTNPDEHWDEEDYDGDDDPERDLKRGTKIAVRTLRNVVLRDVSVVCRAAYARGTSVAARAALNIVHATPPAIVRATPQIVDDVRQRRRNLINLVLG